MRIVSADESQIPLILSFIRKLAEYEKLSHEVTADEQSLRHFLFGPKRAAEVFLAYVGDEAAAFAVIFQNFSTFAGRAGIYLEDLFVEPAYRGRGIGKALLVHLAKLAKERGCGAVNWAVLDWNQPAIDFYRRMGAVPLEEWTVFHLGGEALERLAGEAEVSEPAKSTRPTPGLET